MRKTVLIALIASIGFSNFASANIRAPFMKRYNGSTEIRTSIPNLTVMKEELVFECDVPYRGSLDEVSRQIRKVRTSATYMVSVEKETDAGFVFILTVDQPAQAAVNGIASQVSAPELLENREEKVKSSRGFGVSRYKIAFSGRLKPGLNTITVRYAQPMSVMESMGGLYPIYTTSRFASSFSYDLSPLREWNIDDAFTMNIRIAFRDDSGWLKYLFGSDYEIHLYGVNRKEYESTDNEGRSIRLAAKNSTEIPYRINKEAAIDRIEINFSFKKDFPEMLEVRCDY